MNWRHFLSCLLILLFISSVHAQYGSYANPINEVEKQFITEQLNDRYWVVGKSIYQLPIPEKYRTASAVILNQTNSKEFYRNSKNYLRTTTLEHKVVKILNKEGLEKYSIFSYEHINSDFAFDVTAVKVIKPTGQEYVISLDSITVIKSYDKVEYRNFVIPGLEVGDILDFYYYLEFRVLFPQQYTRVFDAVYQLPQGEDPIMNYHLEFIMGPSAFLNVSTGNLPEFDAVNYKIDRKTFSKYSLDLNELDEIDLDLSSFYPFRELPNLKYQVFIGPYSGHSDIVYNLGGSLKLNTGIQPSRLQDYLRFILAPGRDYKPLYSEFVRYLKDAGVKRKRIEREDIGLQYYYFIRGRRELDLLEGKPLQIDEYQFISRAHYVLSKLHVNHQILLAFDRSLSDINQFTLADEITPMLLIIGDEDMILANPVFNNVPGEIDSKFAGTTAYTYDPSTFRLGNRKISPSTEKDNYCRSEISVSISAKGHSRLEALYSVAGQLKENYQKQILNTAELYLHGGPPSHPVLWTERYSKKKTLQKGQLKLEELREVRDLEITNNIKERLMLSGHGVDSIVWDIIESGNTHTHPEFSWMESYTAEQIGHRGSDSYLVTVKDIIGHSTFRSKMKEDRTEDFYFEYPLTFEASVHLDNIPGYKIGEIHDLINNIENSTGSFQSSAVRTSNGLLIRCRLVWKNSYEDHHSAVMLAEIQNVFLDFAEQKILYRKSK